MSASRREFLQYGTLAGGAALALRVPLVAAAAKEASAARFAPNQWLRIASDGKVTLVVGRSEMGQGVRTSLAMILAEELEADWSRVAIVQASPSPEYEDLNTGGSDSVLSSWMPLRKAAAAAREMLRQAAAQTWKVDVASCRARLGAVEHPESGRRLSYGALVAAASKLPVPKEPPLKSPADFRIVGTRVPRIDGPAITTGKAGYGLDVRVEGMLFAAVARCPVAGGKAVSHDAAKARRVPGVRGVVEIPGGVAVLAEDTWSALSGRDALAVTWDRGDRSDALDTRELVRRLDAAAGEPGHVSRREGDAAAALGSAATRLSATYRDPFQAHATIETGNATARVSGGRCEVWAPTQNPQRVQKESAQLLGIAPEKVTVHVTLLGGGFGRRLGADEATEAVAVARAAGRPVQVVRSRADDFEHDFVHPAGRVDIEAGLDGSGRIVAWTQRYTSYHLSMFGAFDPNAVDDPDANPWGGYDNPYAIPNLRAEWKDIEAPIPTGAWRAVYYPPNVFGRECFLDEIAQRTGRDPLELRRELLVGDFAFAKRRVDRTGIRAALDLAAAKAGWGTPPPQRAGRRSGRGLACNVYHGRTVIAHVADVSVGSAGDVRVHRVVSAVDCGTVVNPLGLEGQIESGIAWGLSYALKGEITVRGGEIEQKSFRDYPVLSIAEAPESEVHAIRSEKPPSGIGEMPVPAVAPAVANAIFAATGKRLRSLPIRAEDLRA